jgi:hypothetical protein
VPPDLNQLLASVMPMVGQVLGGGGGGGGGGGNGGGRSSRSRSPRRGDLSELDAELTAADAARWRARIAGDKAAIEAAAAARGQPRRMSAAFVAAGGLGGGGSSN